MAPEVASMKRSRFLSAKDFPARPRPGGGYDCRWCGQEIKGRARWACSPACLDELLIRIHPSKARSLVRRRDRGVCAACGIDTEWLNAAIRATLGAFDWPYSISDALERRLWWRVARRLTRWEADHIVPCAEGGAGCGLENYRTLCRACHQRETAALARRLAARRQVFGDFARGVAWARASGAHGSSRA